MVVLDLTRVLSGPYATMLLGDLGATVIKIEDPRGGDTTRHSAPFKGGQSHYFLSVNRNKKSVALDISTPEGAKVLLDLCRRADVLIENFRPGTMARLGLDAATLRTANPDLIVCSISGFGQAGPLRDRIAYDVITQAMSGVLSTNGEPEGAPVRLSIPIGDLTGGLLSVIGILASLFGRQARRGRRDVDVSLHDGLLSLLGYLGTLYDVSGKVPPRTGSRHQSIVPYGTFRTQDGWLALAIFTTRFWEKFCVAVGRPGLAADERFRTTKDRMRNRDALETLVEDIVGQRTTAAWEEAFSAADVPASGILSIADALEHEHTQARGMFPAVAHPAYGSVRVPGAPLRLGGDQADHPLPPPLLGEHSVQVLRDLLEMDEAAVAGLQASGVIRTPDARAQGEPA
ncbi:MAG TPA: CoA transferase [Ramlibacter sp.]|nr:CoA transferase [Ramlibacter sp.]